MLRARPEQIEVSEEKTTIRFASPEDTLLHKLLWYEMGDRVSDRQWGDVLGLLKVQGDLLDSEYLDRWAVVVGVSDLLSRAKREAAN